MDVEFVHELRLLVLSGEFGDKYYEILRMYTMIGESKDRYKFGGFSWKTIIASNAPAFLFSDACDDVAGYRGKAKLPDDPEHLLKAFGADSIQQLIHDGVREAWEVA
ncbi:unnamed protein product [Phytophthora fragariaefolia]|uniref:Unnamed protein product n=1 Tax=Phytophthora fragariaefolia TaxID=1490495 RepID=A0A9W6U2T7_9STRA|nr:unnamed protein product [Phytophthora fragariaefolia]